MEKLTGSRIRIATEEAGAEDARDGQGKRRERNRYGSSSS